MTISDPRIPIAADTAMTLGILVLGAGLLLTGKDILTRFQPGPGPGGSPQVTDILQGPAAADLLGALAAAAGLAVVAWWLLSVVCSAAAVALERCGNRRAAAAARRFSPAFMRRLILAALSLQLISGPAHATLAPGPEWMPTRTETSAPATPAASRPEVIIPASRPEDITPASRPEVSTPAVEPGWHPSAPLTDPGLLAPPSVRAGAQTNRAPQERAEEVTVMAGDTLWAIAKKDLGPGASDVEVALHWPRWYQANRTLIGLSPDVLLPGQVLQAPPGR